MQADLTEVGVNLFLEENPEKPKSLLTNEWRLIPLSFKGGTFCKTAWIALSEVWGDISLFLLDLDGYCYLVILFWGKKKLLSSSLSRYSCSL